MLTRPFTPRLKKQDTQAPPEDEDEECGLLLQVCFNKKFMKLCEIFGYSTVPLVGEYSSFYDAVMENKDWMIEGLGEGLIVVAPDYIKKWKIGAEANADNTDLLHKTHFFLEENTDKFGEHLDKMKEIIQICTDVLMSKRATSSSSLTQMRSTTLP